MIDLSRDQYLEFEKSAIGAFAPLNGFMTEEEFHSCVQTGRLPKGDPFPVAVILDVSQKVATNIIQLQEVELFYQRRKVGNFYPTSFFSPDREEAAKKLFGTADRRHPGVQDFMELQEIFVGGRIEKTENIPLLDANEVTPEQSKAYFNQHGFKTVVGFQTRNIPHRGHEFIQRKALEEVDALFVHPLIGKKKVGDFSPGTIQEAYQTYMDHYLPPERVLYSSLTTKMRYAGPREAVFHARIRKNYGCTHFIVGRDHAGVGGFYDPYAAHEIFNDYPELDMKIIFFQEAFYCENCYQVTDHQTCPTTNPFSKTAISGTRIRSIVQEDEPFDARLIRKEVFESLLHQKQSQSLFIQETQT